MREYQRNKNNWIEGLLNIEGKRVEGTREACDVAKEYFKLLFNWEANGDSDKVLRHILSSIIMEMNTELDRCVTDKEIVEVICRFHT